MYDFKIEAASKPELYRELIEAGDPVNAGEPEGIANIGEQSMIIEIEPARLSRTGLPVALMDRAATTGFLAANVLLERWGVRGQTLWTVPDRGRSAVLRGLAGRAGRRFPA